MWAEPAVNLNYAISDRDGYTDSLGTVIDTAGFGINILDNISMAASGRYYRLGSSFGSWSINAAISIPFN